MQLSLPWILSRKRLIAAAIADGALFAFLYLRYMGGALVCGQASLQDWRFAGNLVVNELCHRTLCRGAERVSESDTWDFVGKQLICTGAVLLLTLGITLLHICPLIRTLLGLISQFPIPFLGSLAILSPFLQLTICRLVAIRDRTTIQPDLRWL